jgi:NIMA (never in mitosis gene a)-related kinase
MLHSFAGTPYFMAPEIQLATGDFAYTNKCDIWSLGCLLYTLCSFVPPFYDEDEKPRNLEQMQYTPLKNATIDKVVKRMLMWNPKDRPGCEQLLDDSWVQTQLAKNDEYRQPQLSQEYV